MNLLDTLQAASNTAASNVSGPVDLIAWTLRKLGLPIPAAPVGSSDWMAQKGLTRPVEQGASQVVGDTIGLLSPAVVQQAAPKIAAGLLKAADNAAAPRTLNPQTGAIVWHGSPHKFDKFDSSKIGTGEGAQAYGHGLYLAESPDVAKSYQNLKPIADPTDGGFIQARAAFDIGKGKVKPALKWLDDRAASVQKNAQFLTDGGAGELSQIQRARDLLLGGAFEPGQLYKVDLPDEKIARMLDWDAPLSQQAPEVRQALRQTDWYKHAANVANGPNGRLFVHPDDRTGADFYKMMADADKQSAATLRTQGVPGIKYLDGGSRGAGTGTRNFVVFPGEEEILKILERNGVQLIP